MNRTLLHWICIVCLFGIWIQHGLCATGANAKALRTDLFVTKAYDAKVRPSDNQTDPIEVYVELYLLSINELSEVTETMKVTSYLTVYWTDAFLKWDPANFGDLDYYHWPQGDVWKPDIALKNSNLEYKELGVPSLNVKVTSTGAVTWYPFQVFESTCSMDIMYFPFDVQECKLEFVAWSYSKNEVNMESGAKGIVMDQFEPNSEWKVLDTSYKVEYEKDEAAVVFTIKLKRKPLYHLLSIIMPIIMLAVLNIFVFMLPSGCGEKASYAITVFLSFAVFLTIVATSLPQNSDVVALFAIYVITLTLQSTIITLLALISIRCSLFDDEVTPVPRCVQVFLRVVGCGPCRTSCNVKRIGNSETEGDAKEITRDQFITPKHEKSEPTEETRFNDYTWKEVVNLFDRIGFIFFTVVLVISTIVFFALTAKN